jgi:predicted kinase
MKILLLKGIPGSGKSSFAKDLIDKNPEKYKRINKDDLRNMIDNGKWSSKNEKCVLKVRDILIKQFMEDGYNITIDDTNLDPKHEIRMNEIIQEWNRDKEKKYELEVKFFDISLSEAIERDKKRTIGHVGEKVIRDMYNRYIAPFKKPIKLEQDPSLPHCIICDVDGTIAERTDRGPFEWDKVSTDVPKQEIIELIHNYCLGKDTKFGFDNNFDEQIYVVFFSGRKEQCKGDTTTWISEHVITKEFLSMIRSEISYDLFMRKDDDNRKDSIVKKELFDEHIRGKYYVEFVLDDRNQVVEMWRNELGLTCLQVQDGSF